MILRGAWGSFQLIPSLLLQLLELPPLVFVRGEHFFSSHFSSWKPASSGFKCFPLRLNDVAAYRKFLSLLPWMACLYLQNIGSFRNSILPTSIGSSGHSGSSFKSQSLLRSGWVGAHPSMAPSVAPWARKHHRAPSPDLPTTSPAVPGSAPMAQGLNLWGAGNSICQNMAILFRPQVVYQSKDK